MTDTHRESSFRSRRKEAVAELVDAGWEVFEDPDRQVLPEPLRKFDPDILARRGTELLIVEVKSRRSSDLGQLNALTSAVAEVPNAKLEVNWLGDAPEFDPPIEDIRAYLNEASRLLSLSASIGGLLVAWAALEGSVVYFASDKDEVPPWTTPWQLLSSLFSLGYVSDRDFQRLTDVWRVRNEIAHHVSPVAPQPEDIKFLIGIAERMIRGAYISPDQMVEWFLEHYENPAQRIPYESREGGFQYGDYGPYDARDVLAEQFADATEADINDALEELEEISLEWAAKYLEGED
jgi:hypothetical protein